MEEPYAEDFLVEYSYLSGGIEAISEGRGNKRLLPANPCALAPLAEPLRRGNLMFPRFIAIYQTIRPLVFNEEGEEIFYEKGLDIDDALQGLEILNDDPLHPELIHIIYHERFIPKEIAEGVIKDPRKRVQFSPINRIPKFYEKPAVEAGKFFEEIGGEIQENRLSLEDVTKRHARDARDLGNRIAPYGLTRQEQSFLSALIRI